MITDYADIADARAAGGDLQILYPPGQPAIYRVRTGDDAPPPPEPPTVLPARKFWLAAKDLGYKNAIDAMVAGMDERQQIIVEKETEFDRTNPLFAEFVATLGVTNEEVLAFFAYGANLP
jgi:hypothetical protein